MQCLGLLPHHSSSSTTCSSRGCAVAVLAVSRKNNRPARRRAHKLWKQQQKQQQQFVSMTQKQDVWYEVLQADETPTAAASSRSSSKDAFWVEHRRSPQESQQFRQQQRAHRPPVTQQTRVADLLQTTDALQQLSSSIAYPAAPHVDRSWGQQQHREQQQWQQADSPASAWLQQQQQQQWDQQRWQHDQLVAALLQQQQQQKQQQAVPQALLSSDRLVRDLQDLQSRSSRIYLPNSSRDSSSSPRDSQPGRLQAADEVTGVPSMNPLQQQRRMPSNGRPQMRGTDKHSIEQDKLVHSRRQEQQQQHRGARQQALPDNSRSSAIAAPDAEDVWPVDDDW